MKEFFRGLARGFKEFGETIAVLVNTLLLSLVYIFGVGLSFLLARLGRKHLLEKGSWKRGEFSKNNYRQF